MHKIASSFIKLANVHSLAGGKFCQCFTIQEIYRNQMSIFEILPPMLNLDKFSMFINH